MLRALDFIKNLCYNSKKGDVFINKPSFNSTTTQQRLKQIYDFLLPFVEDQRYQITNYAVLPDNFFETNKEFQKLISNWKFQKPWKDYSVIRGCNYIYRSDLDDIIERDRKAQEEYLKRQEYYKKKLEFITPFNADWILKNIGWLSDEDKYTDAAVLWKHLKNTDWQIYNNEIYIKEDSLKEILKVSPFKKDIKEVLKFNFYRRGKPHKIKLVSQFPGDNNRPRGVYEVRVNDKLFYIGSTNRSFEQRFAEHQENLKNHSNNLYWYSKVNPRDKIEFIPLIDVSQLKCDKVLTEDDIKSMEYAMILAFKPAGNLAGISSPFRYQ